MYKTIICAIEVGPEGKKVIQKAQDLADKYDSALYVVRVLPYTFLPKDYQTEMKEKEIPAFEKFVEKLGINKKHRMLKVGKPYEVICDIADKKKADLIVLGTHSKKGLKSLIGSTATGVANNASCDVVLVRM